MQSARILHFAPESTISDLLRSQSASYESADLQSGVADKVLDIEEIDLPDGSVDIVVCSHVLEHVNDAKALGEIWRVLSPGGRALLMFPVVEGWDHSYENPAHISAADRTIYFGQSDHVRIFGSDVRQRIVNNGFLLSEFTAEEPNVAKYGLSRGEKVFVAVKPA